MLKAKLISTICVLVFLMTISNSYSQEKNLFNKSESTITQTGEDLNSKENIFKLHSSVTTNYDNVKLIEFELGEEASVILTVCNSEGEILETLVNDIMDAGDYKVHYKSATAIVSGELIYKLELKSISGVKNIFAVK